MAARPNARLELLTGVLKAGAFPRQDAPVRQPAAPLHGRERPCLFANRAGGKSHDGLTNVLKSMKSAVPDVSITGVPVPEQCLEPDAYKTTASWKDHSPWSRKSSASAAAFRHMTCHDGKSMSSAAS